MVLWDLGQNLNRKHLKEPLSFKIMNLKIFNLNCWLLPPPFSSENKKRIKKIISLVKRHNPDIITLQEVWLKKYVQKIKNGLEEYTFFHSDSKVFNKSGLLFGTKEKLKHFSSGHFPIKKIHSVHEKIGKKGYQIAEIKPNFHIVNTQLYAPERKGEISITLSQFRRIESLVKGKRVVLSGDLNIHDDEFIRINNEFKYKPLGKFTVAIKNKYANMRFNRPHHANKTIDYIIGTKNAPKVKTELINPTEVSDHYAMIGVVKT
jgi:endonuclease/exonuclease/phosphatase family metal-dependent hydrolase